jgi:gamma-glutamylputrescine oxidase
MAKCELLREGANHPRSYYAATAAALPDYPPLKGEQRADVCIVGGGYTGLSAALHLAERGFKVTVLEAARVGWGASGRNGGQIHSGQRRDQDYLEAELGEATAHRLWALGEQSKALIRELVAKHAIACELTAGLLHGLHKRSYLAATRAYVDKLNEAYGYKQARFVPAEEIAAMVATRDYHGGWYDAGGGHLHPLNFALGLARAATAAGAQIHEASAVTEIGEGDPALVKTKAGEVRASYVLVACNGYLGRLVPALDSRVMPINNYIVATAPLDADRRVIKGDFAVSDSRFVINYYRMSADGRLLFGGGETYSPRFPADIEAFVRKPMAKVFPQLADVAIDYGWGGTLAVTLKRMPYFRKLAPNQFAALGYCGQGVTMATLGGQILAETIAGTLERFDLLATVPVPPFPGGRLMRWPALAAGMTWYALRDRL